jgi:hypothetical protein
MNIYLNILFIVEGKDTIKNKKIFKYSKKLHPLKTRTGLAPFILIIFLLNDTS